MEINPDLNAAKAPPLAARAPAQRTLKAERSHAEFHASVALEKALEQTSDVRSEVVERARELVGQVNYPPRETLRQIATLLAMHFRS
jgi:hypothetical protein